MDILLFLVLWAAGAIGFGLAVDTLITNIKRKCYFVVGVEVFILVYMTAGVVKYVVFH